MHINITLPDITIQIVDISIANPEEFQNVVTTILKLIKETEPKNPM